MQRSAIGKGEGGTDMDHFERMPKMQGRERARVSFLRIYTLYWSVVFGCFTGLQNQSPKNEYVFSNVFFC